MTLLLNQPVSPSAHALAIGVVDYPSMGGRFRSAGRRGDERRQLSWRGAERPCRHHRASALVAALTEGRAALIACSYQGRGRSGCRTR